MQTKFSRTIVTYKNCCSYHMYATRMSSFRRAVPRNLASQGFNQERRGGYNGRGNSNRYMQVHPRFNSSSSQSPFWDQVTMNSSEGQSAEDSHFFQEAYGRRDAPNQQNWQNNHQNTQKSQISGDQFLRELNQGTGNFGRGGDNEWRRVSNSYRGKGRGRGGRGGSFPGRPFNRSPSNSNFFSRTWVNPQKSIEEFNRRQWQYAIKQPPSDYERFTIVSYNILADYLAKEHYSRLYSHIPFSTLDWYSRKRQLLLELGLWSPDIICLQEVDKFEDLQVELNKKGYSGTFKERTGLPSDGCATFWQTSRFELQHQESIEYRTYGFRDNVAQISVLKTRSMGLSESGMPISEDSEQNPTPQQLVVCNVHVYYNPRRGEIKLGQVRVLLDQAKAVSELWNNAPVVLVGDFNAIPKSPLYNFISKGEINLYSFARDAISGQQSCQLLSSGNSQRGSSNLAQLAKNILHSAASENNPSHSDAKNIRTEEEIPSIFSDACSELRSHPIETLKSNDCLKTEEEIDLASHIDDSGKFRIEGNSLNTMGAAKVMGYTKEESTEGSDCCRPMFVSEKNDSFVYDDACQKEHKYSYERDNKEVQDKCLDESYMILEKKEELNSDSGDGSFGNIYNIKTEIASSNSVLQINPVTNNCTSIEMDLSDNTKGNISTPEMHPLTDKQNNLLGSNDCEEMDASVVQRNGGEKQENNTVLEKDKTAGNHTLVLEKETSLDKSTEDISYISTNEASSKLTNGEERTMKCRESYQVTEKPEDVQPVSPTPDFIFKSKSNSDSATSWGPLDLKAATGTHTSHILQHGLKLKSSYTEVEDYSNIKDSSGEPLVTSYNRDFMGTVDYIWHTEELQVVKILDTLPTDILKKSGGFPTQNWGSDHLALACQFAFTPKEQSNEK